MSVQRFLSICTVSAVGLASKAFLNLGFCKNVTVTGLHHLLSALEDQQRDHGRGVVTVSNHVSTLDDPITWGTLPLRCYFNLRHMRWALGAQDIIFTNPYDLGSVFSAFFRNGQVLETVRGAGIYQPAVDTAIDKLNDGAWVHLFGEGRVNQPIDYPRTWKGENTDAIASLPPFKWGTARIIMETKRLPIMLPMWISGFENVMPEGRSFPYKFFPRLRQNVRITIAPPVKPTLLTNILDPLRRYHSPNSPARSSRAPENGNSVNGLGLGPLSDDRPSGLRGVQGETDEKRRLRIALTAVIQQEVEKLGYSVEGPLLGALPRRTPPPLLP